MRGRESLRQNKDIGHVPLACASGAESQNGLEVYFLTNQNVSRLLVEEILAPERESLSKIVKALGGSPRYPNIVGLYVAYDQRCLRVAMPQSLIAAKIRSNCRN